MNSPISKSKNWIQWFPIFVLGICAVGCNADANRLNLEGKGLFEQGQYGPAFGRFQQALRADPKNADSYYNLGAVMHRTAIQTRDKQSVAQAESYYRQAINVNPNHVEANRGLAVILIGQNRQQAAFELVRDWMVRAPGSPDPKIELGRLYHEYGDKSTATQLLSDALNIDYRNARALRALGQIREENGELAQAIANYQRSYQSNTAQVDLPGRIAQLQQRLATEQVGGSGTRVVDSGGSSSR